MLIYLKTKPVWRNDIGQMNLYLNYFKTEESVEGDNEPIGIILSADEDEVLLEYVTGGISNKYSYQNTSFTYLIRNYCRNR